MRRRKPRYRRRRGRKRGLSRGILAVIGVLVLLWVYGDQYFGPGENLVGAVTHVRDGDTIEIAGRAVRLNGLTCDESGTRLGDEATRALQRLVAGQTLSCLLNGDRSHDREVGRCQLRDGRDIGAILIASGVCGRCARYDPFRKYAAAQREAGAFAGSQPGYCWAPW